MGFKVASGYLDQTNPSMYFVKQHINKLRGDKEELLNGEGTDVVQDINDLKSKLQNLGLIDSNGNVLSSNVSVTIVLGTNEVKDAEDLKDNTNTPEIHLKVDTNDKGRITFDIKSAENLLENTINQETAMASSLRQAKSALRAVFTTVDNADSTNLIDNVINNFQNAVNRVETILDNLKSAIIDYNEKLTDSSTGFSALLTNMGHTPASNKFSDVKYAVKNVIRDIINGIANRSVTVGEAVQNLRKLIMGDGTHNGYLQVFQSYKNIERLKEQATFIKTVIEGYKNSLSDQISDVGSSFATLDKHFDIDTNTNQFQLDTLEKVQKLAQNVGSVIQEGTAYYRLVVAKAVADVVDQLSKKIGDAIDNIGEDSEVTTDSSDPSIKHVAAVENLMSDINTAKNNVTNLTSDPNLSLNDFETLVTDKIKAGNEVTFVNNLVNSVTQSLQHLNVADITTTIEASDGDFANAFVAVKSYKNLIDTSSDYIEQRINEVANELSNHQNWQQVISRIDNSISQTVSRLESDATPILNYANGQLEDIENNVYSGVKNDIQNIVNKFNQDKQEYDNIASQILNLTSQLDDDNVDLEQLQSQIVQLAQQQQQIINDIATNWWNTIKNVYSRAHSQYNFYNNRYTPLRNKADDPTQDLSTQEYVNLANYEINTAAYWLEEQILNKLETVLNSLSHTYGSNTVQVQVDIDGGDGLSTEEAEVLLDEITSLAINLPDTLDGAADLVYPDTELDSNDINSIDITV